MVADSQKQANERAEFEEKVKGENSREEWLKYCEYELKQQQVKRAKAVYERALGSCLEMENDIKFF